MINIVIPMAGRGARFAAAGYAVPKPLVPVNGRPMIELVADNVRPAAEHRFIFIALREHLREHGVAELLGEIAPGCEVIALDEVTQGAACTVLLARELIDTSDPLMIANSDQWVEGEIDAYLARLDDPAVRGLIMTMWADHPKWSYARIGPDGTVSEVVEKEVVSNEATVGIYNFRCGSDYVRAAEAMIAGERRVNGEFYVAPVYNELIAEGARVVFHNVGAVGDGMYGLGTPEDLEQFLASGHA